MWDDDSGSDGEGEAERGAAAAAAGRAEADDDMLVLRRREEEADEAGGARNLPAATRIEAAVAATRKPRALKIRKGGVAAGAHGTKARSGAALPTG